MYYQCCWVWDGEHLTGGVSHWLHLMAGKVELSWPGWLMTSWWLPAATAEDVRSGEPRLAPSLLVSPPDVLLSLRGHAVDGEVWRGRQRLGLAGEAIFWLNLVSRLPLVHAVYVSLEVISAAETLSTLLTLIRPLACVSPQVFSIILFCEELLPTLLASEYHCDYFRSFVSTFYLSYLWALICKWTLFLWSIRAEFALNLAPQSAHK